MSYLGNPLTSQNFPSDYFTGNGTQTNFVLSQTPASATAIQVYVGGVKQVASPINPSYFVTGNILVLSAAPNNNTPIEVNYLGLVSQVNVPANYSIQQNQLSLQVTNTFVTLATANGLTSSFTLLGSPISANTMTVTANGIVQWDYTVVNNTLTFGFTPPANTLIRAQGLQLAQAGIPSDASVTSTKLTPNLTLTGNTSVANLTISGTLGPTTNVANLNISGNLVASNGITFADGTTQNHGVYGFNSNNSVLVMNTTVTGNVVVSSNTGAFSVGPVIFANGSSIQVAANARYVIF